jgi:hypothetical protein
VLAVTACQNQSGENQFCKQATLYAGDPTYAGTAAATDGLGMLADPPLDARALAFAPDGTVVAVTPTALWTLDGLIEHARCPAVTFQGAKGVTFAMDGTTLIVADAAGGAIDSIDASCTEQILSSTGLNQPSWPSVGADGTIYFLDAGNRQVKKIAGGTTTALGNLDANVWTGMTMAAGRLYLSGNATGTSTVVEIDPASGSQHTVAMGDGLVWIGGDPGQSVGLEGIATDGDFLFTTGGGWVWRLSRDGNELNEVAGTGYVTDYPVGYNPDGPHGADNLALIYTEGRTGLAYSGTALYIATKAKGAYVEALNCP